MKLVSARTSREMADAATLMQGLMASNMERYANQVAVIREYYRGSWFLDDYAGHPRPVFAAAGGCGHRL